MSIHRAPRVKLEFDDRAEPVVEVAAPEGIAAYDVGAAIADREA